MKRPSTDRHQRKAFIFISIILLVAAISLTIFIVHKPQVLLKKTASTILPPPTPPPSERFSTLPPGSALPSEAECASRVRKSLWEPRPDNYTANHRVPTAQQISGMAPWNTPGGFNPKADTIRKQITGNFTGTTDEIFQWVACKWGIDEDIIRADAVVETHWHQNGLGDRTTDSRFCPPGTWGDWGCYQSYGVLQIKYIYNRTAWPMSRDDTAFNVEYAYGLIRSCYEGWTSYLHNRTPVPGYPHYQPGDLWGCIGSSYSGGWYDQGAINYISKVETQLANKAWRQPGF